MTAKMADVVYLDTSFGGDEMTTPEEVESKLATHEAVCTERYNGINGRLKRIESILIGAAGAIILLLINIVLEMSR